MADTGERVKADREFLGEIGLTDKEMQVLESAFELADEATEKRIMFSEKLGPVAFTPGAALAIGVANLTFAVYTEYGKSLAGRRHIQHNLKKFAEDLVKLEMAEDGAAPLSVAQRFRGELKNLRRKG